MTAHIRSGPFQSTRPLRGGTAGAAGRGGRRGISIHPPLAGRDNEKRGGETALDISIHPPLAGRDCDPGAAHGDNDDFNPPAPCGAGLSRSTRPRRLEHFNPPAPCGAGLLGSAAGEILEEFQSTRPLRGGTVLSPRYVYLMAISIHPPLAGRDCSGRRPRPAWTDFNPPAPCGAGQRSCTKKLCKTSHIAQKVHLPWPY